MQEKIEERYRAFFCNAIDILCVCGGKNVKIRNVAKFKDV